MVKLTLRERESIQEAVRRFRKLVERSGIKKEMRRREYYEKPSEIKRRARLRAERRSRRGSTMSRGLYAHLRRPFFHCECRPCLATIAGAEGRESR